MTYYWGMDSPIPLGQYLYDYMHPDGANYSPGLNYFNLKPGTSFNYCNNAVALLGYLIEVIGDSTFSYQTQKGIFEPLEMNETSWFISELDSMNFAMPYYWNTTTYVPYGHFSYSDYPAGALRTSVDQLAKFLMCYMEGGTYQGQQILQGSTIEMMLTPQVPQIYPNIGLIWFRSSSGNRDLWGHTGEISASVHCSAFARMKIPGLSYLPMVKTTTQTSRLKMSYINMPKTPLSQH